MEKLKKSCAPSCVPKTPCANCPYRKDAPLQLWEKSHFEEVIQSENAEYGLGAVFYCHKHTDKSMLCGGWLLTQKTRNIPNTYLKLLMLKKWVTLDYENFKKLKKPKNVDVFTSPKMMAYRNFPELMENL
jgi:hypothetical protein